EKYVWKAWIDSTHNENINLETGLHHYCFSSKSTGSFYDLNLTKMIKIINFLRGLITIEKALEETDNDVYTQYSREEDYKEIILQYLEFSDKEKHVELTKQKIEEFRKKAEAQGLFNISTNKGKELWKEPIKNTRY
ncbi:19753_t:CDS:1, partial [Gigaspora rosea]